MTDDEIKAEFAAIREEIKALNGRLDLHGFIVNDLMDKTSPLIQSAMAQVMGFDELMADINQRLTSLYELATVKAWQQGSKEN